MAERRTTGARERARDSYATAFCQFLVAVAAGSVTQASLDKLDKRFQQARRAGTSERGLKTVERNCEKAMAPGLKKLYGVDVRKQGKLF